ncbi:hypothetical protein [Aquisphaera insulae]|uniref:hypothetical protein n=1 Tax=Aquisphaera insulae TaxID=2712864 RepID=UPI0013ECF5E0|nr:hypothetical protein [Aquisphaera insulae]
MSLALASAAIAGLAAWAVGIASLPYDHDEVTKAHSVWLAGQGLVPYVDFLDSHPPYFPLLVPLAGRPDGDPVASLWNLRRFSLVGNLLFLGGLAAFGLISQPPGSRAAEGSSEPATRLGSRVGEPASLWGMLGFLAIALHPTILTFLVEFRVDGWAYALATWSLVRLRRDADRASRFCEIGFVGTFAALLLCPKLAILTALIVGGEILAPGRAVRERLARSAAFFGGGLAGCGLFAAYLGWERIPFARFSDMVFAFNAIHNANAGYAERLRHSIAHDTLPLGVVVAGVSAWLWLAAFARRGKRAGMVHLAILTWLVFQACVVSYPFKQYYAPWFLVATAFAFPLGSVIASIPRRWGTPIFLACCAALVVQSLLLARSWAVADEARSQRELISWMARVTLPADRVAAAPPLHPIVRRDAFMLWFSTYDPSGFDAEQVLRRIPTLRRFAEPAWYREELERDPPALVVVSGDVRVAPRAAGQQAAITEFFRRHPYHAVRAGGAWFALRPDRYERARAEGLLPPGG